MIATVLMFALEFPVFGSLLNASKVFPSPLKTIFVGALTVIGPRQVVVSVVHRALFERSRISIEFVLWTAAKANLPSGVTAMLSVSAGKEIADRTPSRVLSMIAT